MTFLVAQTAMPPAADWFTPLLNLCVLGPVCYWFMRQEERRATERGEEEDHRNEVLRELTKALNSNSNALMVAVLALKNGDANIAELAHKIADDTKLRT